MVEAFVRNYQYNIDMAPSRTQLQSLTQGPNESFKEYAQKWRELADRVQPPMMERELVDMFMGTLQGPYYDRMVESTSVGFSELVMEGERIEVGLKMDKIQSANAGSFVGESSKKSFSGYPKKKESEYSDVYIQRDRGKTQQQQQQQQVNDVTIPVAVAPQAQQPHYQKYQNSPRHNYNQQRQPIPEKVFYSIPMSYCQVLHHLLQLKLVNMRNMPAPHKRLPAN